MLPLLNAISGPSLTRSKARIGDVSGARDTHARSGKSGLAELGLAPNVPAHGDIVVLSLSAPSLIDASILDPPIPDSEGSPVFL
jgi:hypothetical protein